MKPIPLIDGVFVIDNSGLEKLRCPRAFEYSELERRTSTANKAGANFGSTIHKGLETRYQKVGSAKVDELTQLAIETEMLAWLTENPQPEMDFRNYNHACKMMRVYNHIYGAEQFKIMNTAEGKPIIEASFCLPFGEIEIKTPAITSDNGGWMELANTKKIPIYYSGKIDLGIKDNNGIWSFDHKTAFQFGDGFDKQMNMDGGQLGYCYHPETELLTPRGWIKIGELNPSDTVMQWDYGKLSFVKPTKHFARYVNENLISLSGKVNLLTTKEHRQVTNNRRRGGSWREYTSESIPLNFDERFLCGGVTTEYAEIDRQQLIYMVMLQADGCILESGASRFHFKRPRKIERCRKHLKDFNVSYTETVQSDQTTVFYIHQADELNAKAIRALGKQKKWGNWLLLLNQGHLNAFIEELQYWDGSDRESRGLLYFTPDKDNALMVQTIAALVGRRASKHYQAGWRVNISDDCMISTSTVERTFVPYSGTVFCVNVPSSYLLTRLNETIVVSGNCWALGQVLGEKPQGYIIDAIRVRRPTKQQEFSGVEPIDGTDFKRIPYYVSQDMLDEWREDTMQLIKGVFAYHANNHFPRHRWNCTNKYGACEFYDVCGAPRNQRESVLHSGMFEVNTWAKGLKTEITKQESE